MVVTGESVSGIVIMIGGTEVETEGLVGGTGVARDGVGVLMG
jgi:hypothetical protein